MRATRVTSVEDVTRMLRRTISLRPPSRSGPTSPTTMLSVRASTASTLPEIRIVAGSLHPTGTNMDIPPRTLKGMKGKVKEQWNMLTDDDIEAIAGKPEQLLGLLQQRFGYAREQAEEECRRFLERWSRGGKRAERAESHPHGSTSQIPCVHWADTSAMCGTRRTRHASSA